MLVKIMKADPHINEPDYDSRRSFSLFTDVQVVNFQYVKDEDGRLRPTVNMDLIRNGASQGVAFGLDATVYVMTDSGKTIETFTPFLPPT